MPEGQVPDGEGLILGVSRLDPPLVLVIELAQAHGHLAAARAGGGDHHQGAGGLHKFVLSIPPVSYTHLDVYKRQDPEPLDGLGTGDLFPPPVSPAGGGDGASELSLIHIYKLGLKTQPELLEEIFQEALQHLDRNASQHQISVELEDDLLMANVDARLLVQVVINIVNNAIKYTPEGSHITLSAHREGDQVEVEIADDGPGIDQDAKDRIFDMFYTCLLYTSQPLEPMSTKNSPS